jgi:dihydrofolate reductase
MAGVLLSMIVAMAENGVIGRDNALPWHLPEDLRHFKATTLGKAILMGRKTFAAIGKPLPGRVNHVLTRARDWRAEGVTVVHSLSGVNDALPDGAELVVIGGAEIYRLCMPFTRRIYLTRVHATVPGDTVFPALDMTQWRETARVERARDERNAYDMTFVTLECDGAPEAISRPPR